MSQPVKLSDALVLDARIAAEAQQHSIAGQVEFWATLGKSVELLLNGKQVHGLLAANAAQILADSIQTVESPEGRARVATVLASRPYPHFKQAPGQPDLLIRIDGDGTKTLGRFVNRTFIARNGLDSVAAPAHELNITIAEAKAQYGKSVAAPAKAIQRKASGRKADGKRAWA
jgi:hypothetical protein